MNMFDPVDAADAEFVKELEKRDNENESSSDSDVDKYYSSTNTGKNRLFGREKPIHLVLGGGKSADIILWRNKHITGSMYAAATVIWLLFEWIGYHLLTFICHSLILLLATLFLWSNLSSFLNTSPPDFPKIVVQENLIANVALLIRGEINCAIKTFRDVASGNDIKKFLSIIVALWIVSVVGSWLNFLTLVYLAFVLVFTVPVLYEKHEDIVDIYAEKALVEVRKHYAVLDEKVLQKIPISAFNKDKQH